MIKKDNSTFLFCEKHESTITILVLNEFVHTYDQRISK